MVETPVIEKRSNVTAEIGRAVRFYWTFMREYRARLVRVFFYFLIKHGAMMMFPLIIKLIVDRFMPEKRLDLIFASIGLVVILALINMFFHSRFKVLEAEISKFISLAMRQRLVEKLQLLSLQYHQHAESGRHFSKLVVDVEKCERFSQFLLNTLLGGFFTFGYAVGVLLVVDWRILLIYFLSIPAYLLIYRFFKKRFARLQHQARLANEDLSQSVSHFIQTSTLSRLYGEETYERNRVSSRSLAIVDRYKAISREIGVFQILTHSSGQIFLITMIAFCAWAVMSGQMTVGSLMLFLQYIGMMIATVGTLLDQFPILTEFSESVHSIQEVLAAPDEERNEGKKEPKEIRGRFEIREIGFHYTTGKSVLHKVTLDIPAGSSIGLVGTSGSGKTTLINLLLGLLRPTAGKILLDGENLEDLDLRTVRKHVGVVTQEPILFKGTVYENIAYAKESLRPEDVEAAARLANAHDFILRLDKGYDSIIGERGVTLSGGQKQRIAIARAILRRPKILILDEATSALDPDSEKEVQIGIDQLVGKQTTLVIAHRLSTLFKTDRIVVLSEGQIAETGSHNELIEKGGIYAHLLMTQMNLNTTTLQVLKNP